jgi:hypothetical protein
MVLPVCWADSFIGSPLETKRTFPPATAPTQINTAGMQAWTLVVNLKDTPEGLKIDNELIIGAAALGYDKEDAGKGAPKEAATILNDNLIRPALAAYAPGEEFMRSIDAISRHVTEEFSMFRFFLPTVWKRFPQLETLSGFGNGVQGFFPKVNYGLGMVTKPFDTTGLTEMMAPLNGAALKNTTQLKKVMGAAPEAIKTGLGLNLQSQVQSSVKSVNNLIEKINAYPAKKANLTGH